MVGIIEGGYRASYNGENTLGLQNIHTGYAYSPWPFGIRQLAKGFFHDIPPSRRHIFLIPFAYNHRTISFLIPKKWSEAVFEGLHRGQLNTLNTECHVRWNVADRDLPLASAVPSIVAEIGEIRDPYANEDGEGSIGPTALSLHIGLVSLLAVVGKKIREYETTKAVD
ncbi:hypothetical protein ARMSODRAFT_980577 [Armillaria solidipes]|uniref:Uncharacterized protein n=1 Tax=Armillaria solidipes TaxID=1076256 RepID=A0A2H3AUT2_9AGAR|nr:hypothetical protein ARMSODRAFT_980577 [Armillaria solidipes]